MGEPSSRGGRDRHQDQKEEQGEEEKGEESRREGEGGQTR